MDKSVLIQKQVKDNAEDIHSFMTDMKSWEEEMKRKEAEITGIPYKKELPPVRSKVKKQKSDNNKTKFDRPIAGLDYNAWDKYDADKACEEVDIEEEIPPSLDSEMSEKEKLEKLREEAQEEKEKGNQFVKQQKWDDAIGCYTRAIALHKDDAIYYANRGLCHLKKENFHAAEADCTRALELNPKYVKALQRRSCAREALGSLRRATADVRMIIELEPNNVEAKRQLAALVKKMGTKGPNSKISPATTPVIDCPPELPLTKTVAEEKPIENSQDSNVIHAIDKPPHLRSKKPLIRVPVTEIPLGRSKSQQEDRVISSQPPPSEVIIPQSLQNGVCEGTVDSVNMSSLNIDERDVSYQIPKSSVQFLSQWKLLKGNNRARSQYLKLISPKDIPSIFQNSLESDVLSEIIDTLSQGDDLVTMGDSSLLSYLENIAKVKRFGALTMFLSSKDKEGIKKILKQCLEMKVCTEDMVDQIKNKYEI